MREYIKEPADPIGDAPIAIWQRLFKRWTKQFLLRGITGGLGVSVRQIPDPNGGYHYVISVAPSKSGSSASAVNGLAYLGTYDPSATYQPGNLVVIQNGPNQGAYLCLTVNNNTAPYTGQGWVQLGGFYTAGLWV